MRGREYNTNNTQIHEPGVSKSFSFSILLRDDFKLYLNVLHILPLTLQSSHNLLFQLTSLKCRQRPRDFDVEVNRQL
jgi:hypothetical protein